MIGLGASRRGCRARPEDRRDVVRRAKPENWRTIVRRTEPENRRARDRRTEERRASRRPEKQNCSLQKAVSP
nr:hypothetical protein Itr_chr12CG05470 [Ipomoea trifida]